MPDDSGNEVERDIPFLRGYNVFNVEQIAELPEHYYENQVRNLRPPSNGSITQKTSFLRPKRKSGTAAAGLFTPRAAIISRCRPLKFLKDPESSYATLAHESTHGIKHPTLIAA
jgi:antirestriction protein ArdC